jgi:hypothetical protein
MKMSESIVNGDVIRIGIPPHQQYGVACRVVGEVVHYINERHMLDTASLEFVDLEHDAFAIEYWRDYIIFKEDDYERQKGETNQEVCKQANHNSSKYLQRPD